MIVCVYTLKKRFVIRNKTLCFLNQNALSFYFGQTSYMIIPLFRHREPDRDLSHSVSP